RAFHFIGVDVQYFAALLFPSEEQLGTPDHSYIEFAKPVIVKRDPVYAQWSDISVRLHAYPVAVAPGQQEVHSYTLFAGPKRTELLRPLGADAVLDFSTWFGIGYVSKGLVWLLNLLHSIGIPYGIAILLMTVMVRGAMYPISRKQALGAKKMKELQPQLQELKKKYAKDKEKLARAQMELFAKHRYNPLAGCLPMLLQLPIFIGLYQSLRMSVDLRLASFLWIDNLAAPDALFPLPFRVPFLGWTEFNLLPILTVVLFLVQQKMFMPPATDEQTEMQQKMMTYMMVFFGFLFYRLPSGLCLYFIASSLWGMGERKLLDYTDTKEPPPQEPATPSPPKKKTPGWLARLSDQLDASAQLKKLDGQPAI
ncbi:MAG TPA: membrane protein insertase YidC, partial [Planctomycetaceae bacterium]|nr:membrane protein insertase YidC [Planctomycetaceae bacterium]